MFDQHLFFDSEESDLIEMYVNSKGVFYLIRYFGVSNGKSILVYVEGVCPVGV